MTLDDVSKSIIKNDYYVVHCDGEKIIYETGLKVDEYLRYKTVFSMYVGNDGVLHLVLK